MACCMVGLLMIYQLIDAWQRCRQWLRRPLRWMPAPGAPVPVAPRTPRGRIRGSILLALLVFQVGFVTTFAFTHRARWQADVAGMVSAAQNMCLSVRAFAARRSL